MKDLFISYKQALALKELGFNEECFACYDEKGVFSLVIMSIKQYYTNSKEDTWNCAAPTIAEVVMWLYEKYGIWIACEASKLNKFNYRISKREKSKLASLPFVFEIVTAGYDFNSPTEAYEAAIIYTLKNLI